MRTKKTNLKSGIITRTIQFTKVTYLSVNLETREVEEHEHIFTMGYTAEEAEKALREKGLAVAVVTCVEVYEQKFAMDYDSFITFGHIVD